MKNKSIGLMWSEVAEMMQYLGEDFDMVFPNMAQGYSVNFEKLCRAFSDCSDACKYVTGIIEKPEVTITRNMRFWECIIIDAEKFDCSDDSCAELGKTIHSVAFSISVLLLAKINPLLFADYFATFPTVGDAEDKRAMTVVTSIMAFAKKHDIPLNGRNNCNASCADCL